MNKILIIIFFLIVSASGYGQDIVKGEYSFSYTYSGATLTIKDSFNYEYYYHTCTGTTSDFGKYELRKDTLIFHSLLSQKELTNNEIEIRRYYSIKDKNEIIDTLFISLQNNTDSDQSVDIELGDSLLCHIDSLRSNEWAKSYTFLVHKNTDSLKIVLKIDTLKAEVMKCNIIDFEIKPKYYFDKKQPFNDVLIYKNRKMFSLNEYKKYNRKSYYVLQK